MRELNYKLIVSDFDGTLVSSNGTVTRENINAINDYIAAGGIFAISTGRLPAAILPHAEKLGLKGIICCGQGTIILDIATKELLFEDRLSLETTLEACEKMEQMGLHIHAFDLWDYYSNRDNDMLKFYEDISGTRVKGVIEGSMTEFLREKNMRVYKLLGLVEPKDNQKAFDELIKADIMGCGITKSMDFLVEVVNPEYSKGTAIKYLAKHYGIPIEKAIGIGDNYNDIEMIEAAGLGVSVKNGEEALKQKAGYVCERTNNQSAIAEVIEKFGFK